MAKAWANVKTLAQNTIQAGEKDEVNLWVERTQWLPYLVGIERPELMACVEEPVADLDLMGDGCGERTDCIDNAIVSAI
jgi:hypothetical protein